MTADQLLDKLRPKEAAKEPRAESPEEGGIFQSSGSSTNPAASSNSNRASALMASAEAFDASPTQEINQNALIAFLALMRRADREAREYETLVRDNETLRTRLQLLKTEKQMSQMEIGTLQAEDGKLRTDNQKLWAENKLLRSEDGKLRAEDEKLRGETRWLRTELEKRVDLSDLVENFENSFPGGRAAQASGRAKIRLVVDAQRATRGLEVRLVDMQEIKPP